MELKLTDEQVRDLLKLAYLGNWLANGNRSGSEEDPHIDRFEKLVGHLFSASEVSERQLEDELFAEQLIDAYNEETFWDELVERLAHRDFERLWGLCPDRDELSEEMRAELDKTHARYEHELEENGIDRLEVMHTIEDVLGPDHFL